MIAGASATGNVVQGNVIGTDVTGTAYLTGGPSRRTNKGVWVAASAFGTVIGTDGDGVNDATEGNLISGNGYGVALDSSAAGTVIAGNFIGTDATGTVGVGNDSGAIRTLNSNVVNTRIGTNADGVSDVLERNVVSGLTGADGNIFDVGTGTVIAGNFIGTDEKGQTRGRIRRRHLAGSARIGTNADGGRDAVERNVISGNQGAGFVHLRRVVT